MFAFIILALYFSCIHAQHFYGVDYGVDPITCPTLEDMTNDFAILHQYTDRIRIFGADLCNQAELALQATQSLGMRLYLGIWIDEHPETFDKEFASLQRAIEHHNLDNVDGIIVGSEVLYREDQSLGYLIDRIRRVRNAMQGYNIPITSADTFNKITPELANEIDFVMINVFPYWEGVSIDNAANTVLDHYHEAVNKASGKVVRISETGWPTAGANYMESVPSPENQQRYMREILCRTQQAGIDMLWFSAIDEPYKNDVEGHFGFLHAQDRTLKPALRIQQQDWNGPC